MWPLIDPEGNEPAPTPVPENSEIKVQQFIFSPINSQVTGTDGNVIQSTVQQGKALLMPR